MHEAAKIVPVVIDESLVDLESFQLSRKLGYSGVALKVCKGQSHAVLMAAAAQKYKSFLCVQDLTCPGASLVHSASLASHIPVSSPSKPIAASSAFGQREVEGKVSFHFQDQGWKAGNCWTDGAWIRRGVIEMAAARLPGRSLGNSGASFLPA